MTEDRLDYRKCLAEFIGTFALVFIGCGACIAHHTHSSDITHVGVALAFGGVVMCMVYALGHISGAHINPAVTIAFAVVRRFPWRCVGPYIVAQCSGAILASGLHPLLFGREAAAAAAYGATAPAGIGTAQAFGLEAVLTFFLMFVIVAVATDSRAARNISGLAIGAVVTFDCLAAGKCCGASMNPARSLGPAVFAGGTAIRALWLYWLAPAAGAVVAALAYEWVKGEDDSGHSAS